VPEDRFGDLGTGAEGEPPRSEPERAPGEERAPGNAERAPGAAERLSELDEEPSQEQRPEPEPARPGGRYTWVVGVAAAIAVIAVSINSLPNVGRGFRGPGSGGPLPSFAAPSAAGSLDGDANIRQRGEGTPEEGAVPACSVQGPDVVKVCGAPYRHQVVTFVTPGCEDQLDRVESVRAEFPTVAFTGVVSGRSRADVSELAGDHDWGFPVAADPDNAVFNLYRAGDCPTTTFAYRGGEVKETRLGPLTEADLSAALEELSAGPGQASG